MLTNMNIGSHIIDRESPVYIIGEMSGNHNCSLEKAVQIIREAKACGADAVKLQTYRADTITLDSTQADFLLPEGDPWHYKHNLYNLYAEAYTPWEWHSRLFEEASAVGIDIFSSPFDLSSVDFLEELHCPAYKIASPEITDIPLLRRVAQTGKPVILSTGLGEISDIELAVTTLRQAGCIQLALLKCTASYPAAPETMNLQTIPDMAKRFNCISGLSDHTLGVGVPIAAVALGAKIIEKHFVLDRSEKGVDSFFSLEPQEFSQMVDEVRKVEKALGTVSYQVPGSFPNKFKIRRSLYVAKQIQPGDLFTPENVKSVRPSWGLHPRYYDAIIGKRSKVALKLGDRLSLDYIDA